MQKHNYQWETERRPRDLEHAERREHILKSPNIGLEIEMEDH